MALPGVTTVIKDRFYSVSTQNNAADAPRIAILARRSNTEGEAVATGGFTPRDYDAFQPRGEEDVILAYGENSELHRAYVEVSSTGAPRISLVAIPADVTDEDLQTSTVLDKAFEAAEAIQPGIIVPWGRGGHPDDWAAGATPETHTYPNIGFAADSASSAAFLKGIADRCKQISDRTRPVFAVMGITPYMGNLEDSTPSAVYQNMTAAEAAAHMLVSELPDHNDGSMGVNGSYLTVVATEIAPVRYPEAWGYSNGAAMYAGYLASLPSEIAPTGKQIFNVGRMRYNPTRSQQEHLIDNAVVPIALNFQNQATIIDGVTFGKSTSDYTRQTTLRITFDAIQLVRRAAQPFIGQPYTLTTNNALDTAVTAALRSMMINGALQDAQHIITPIRRENKVQIDLTLWPAFEMRNIDVSVSVQL